MGFDKSKKIVISFLEVGKYKSASILFAFIFTTLYNSYSQNTIKRAIYKLNFINTEDNIYLNEAKKQENSLNFNLDFNKTYSQFYIVNNNVQSERNINVAIAFSGSQSTIFTDLKNKKISYQSLRTLVSDENEYLVTDSIFDNWELLNESKKINEFICYKAIRKTKTIGTKIIKDYTQIAWYCPEIPFSFGPTFSSGLPGLVIEFQDNNNYYHLKKIIDLEQKFKFKNSFKGIPISKKSYNDTLRSRHYKLKLEILKKQKTSN